ncbi:adenylate/guanylate cyclase domain-containing protein [Nocardioides taihuensis]|uniref:Adenylate/guanylate cyclase domain-containing protein n=1 Tax=Nocardioides taihuensis TaxID=1835606 RepID=A0ABW0BJC1_9ACTN
MTRGADPTTVLAPFVPRLLGAWPPTGTDERHVRLPGSLAFLDISGFTRLTERLARRGKVGAEEMSDALSATFAGLLTAARDDDADLVKWGGDAVLLLFRGPDHALRAARCAHRMRATLRQTARDRASTHTLRMSVGIHSGDLDLFLVGDPALHRELLVCGPAATVVARTESAAATGQIGLSAATAALLPSRLLGAPLLDGRTLRSAPVLADLQPSPAAAFDPSPLLPRPIREHLLQEQREPEHRLITVAFLQVSGVDALLEHQGPQVVADELDALVRTVQQACADTAVTFFETDIARDGFKVMLTAGAPRSSGHDEERMLRVAHRVLAEPRRLEVRIGVNRGRVFSGDFGPSFRRTYSVKGDAVNLAARLASAAPPGEAWATPAVVEHADSAFDTRDLPPLTLKGKAAPVRAVVVGAPGHRRVRTGRDVRLTGRDAEVSLLRGVVADVRAGERRVVDLVADPGMGRSRLVAELLASVDDLPVVRAHGDEYEGSTPYFPFRRLLREALGLEPASGADEVADRVAALAASGPPRLAPWLPLLGLPLDVPLAPTAEVEQLDGQFRAARLESVVVDVLRECLPTTAVLVLEDAHLVDDASASLLRALVAHPQPPPWLVVVSRQDVAAGFVPEGTDVTALRLPPFPEEASLAYLHQALEDLHLPPRTLEALARRSGGNPLFLDALAAEVRRSGPGAVLPESVERLVASQVDRLEPADRAVLRTAAVLGNVVDRGTLAGLVGDRLAGDTLTRLAPFLEQRPDGHLRFRNALLRDVAYEGLPYRRRRALHEQVGTALEVSDPEDAEVLSLHFAHAGRHDKAWHYSVVAGDRALAKYAYGDAVDFLQRAAAAAPHSDAGDREVARVLEMLADSLFLLGRADEATSAFARARSHLHDEPVLLAGIVEKEARIDHRRRRWSQAMRRLSRGLHALDGLPGARAAVARSLLCRRYAFSLFNQGRVDEALTWAGRAADEAEASGDRDALAQAHEMLNAVHVGSGRPEPVPYGRLALAAYTELGNLPRQAHCHNNLGLQAFDQGRWDEALADYAWAVDAFRRIGDAANESNAQFNRAELLVRQGREAEAGPLLGEVLRDARAVEDDELVALTLRELGRVAAVEEGVDVARRVLREARAAFADLGEDDEVAATDLALAETLLAAGLVEEAAGLLAGADPTTPTALRLRAVVALAGTRYDEARALVGSGLDGARVGGDRYEEGLLLATLADVHAAADPGTAAVTEASAQAAAVLEPMGVVLSRRSRVRRG